MPSTFWIATSEGVDTRSGYVMRGLGLGHDGWAKDRRNTEWTLTHIGSGTAVCRIVGSVATVMPVATEIAQCGDWMLFDLPDGWQQTDPELPARVQAILDSQMPGVTLRGRGRQATADEARAVIAAREAHS